MPSKHISFRIHQGLKNRFERYAASLDVGASELLRLLIAREYRLRRLTREHFDPDRQSGAGNASLPTVTAHMLKADDVRRFGAYAEACGITRNEAGAWLIETELREQWLEKAIAQV